MKGNPEIICGFMLSSGPYQGCGRFRKRLPAASCVRSLPGGLAPRSTEASRFDLALDLGTQAGSSEEGLDLPLSLSLSLSL